MTPSSPCAGHLTDDARAIVGQVPRARDLGIEIGRLPSGPANAITDVDGVRRRPHDADRGRQRPDGSHRRRAAARAALRRRAPDQRQRRADRARMDPRLRAADDADRAHEHALRRRRPRRARRRRPARRGSDRWSLPVVGETWDGFLNDINGFHVKPEHVASALAGARAAARSRRALSAAAPAWSATASRAGSGPPRASSRTAGSSACSCRRTTAAGTRLRVNGVPVGERIGPERCRYPRAAPTRAPARSSS